VPSDPVAKARVTNGCCPWISNRGEEPGCGKVTRRGGDATRVMARSKRRGWDSNPQAISRAGFQVRGTRGTERHPEVQKCTKTWRNGLSMRGGILMSVFLYPGVPTQLRHNWGGVKLGVSRELELRLLRPQCSTSSACSSSRAWEGAPSPIHPAPGCLNPFPVAGYSRAPANGGASPPHSSPRLSVTNP
jgi:hypothetical protein